MQTLNKNNYGATLADAERHLSANEPFHTGTLSGATEEDAYGVVLYVVRSYGVQIAQRDAFLTGTEVIDRNAYTHSVTTSKHANIVKKAWGI